MSFKKIKDTMQKYDIKNLHVWISITTLVTVFGFVYYATTYKTNIDRDIESLDSRVEAVAEDVILIESNYRDMSDGLIRIEEWVKYLQKSVEEIAKKND